MDLKISACCFEFAHCVPAAPVLQCGLDFSLKEVRCMWSPRLSAFRDSFTSIFNTRDDGARGRVINLGCTLLAAFYNVFITGIFYTGFLSMSGISITGAGIVTYIPYNANIFSIFSSRVLSRFHRRKPILIAS